MSPVHISRSLFHIFRRSGDVHPFITRINQLSKIGFIIFDLFTQFCIINFITYELFGNPTARIPFRISLVTSESDMDESSSVFCPFSLNILASIACPPILSTALSSVVHDGSGELHSQYLITSVFCRPISLGWFLSIVSSSDDSIFS